MPILRIRRSQGRPGESMNGNLCEEYFAAREQAKAAYDAAKEPVQDAYDAAMEPVQDAYEAATKPIQS